MADNKTKKVGLHNKIAGLHNSHIHHFIIATILAVLGGMFSLGFLFMLIEAIYNGVTSHDGEGDSSTVGYTIGAWLFLIVTCACAVGSLYSFKHHHKLFKEKHGVK